MSAHYTLHGVYQLSVLRCSAAAAVVCVSSAKEAAVSAVAAAVSLSTVALLESAAASSRAHACTCTAQCSQQQNELVDYAYVQWDFLSNGLQVAASGIATAMPAVLRRHWQL
jgi:hypothetical protein